MQDLRMLSHALGFSERAIERRLSQHEVNTSITTTELLNFVERGIFAYDLHEHYDSRSGTYNSLVLAKAIKMIDAKLFSFGELKKIRMAYEIYEMCCTYNLKHDHSAILRSIQFCDRSISPLKLKHRLRHISPLLHEPGKLHLYDYIDIVLSSQPITKVKFSRPQTAGILEKESNECYKLNSQDPCTDEQYMLRQLDELYLHEERNWNFNEIQFQDKMNENAVWPAIVIRKHRIQNANEVQKQLQNQLVESRSSLKLSRARSGYSSTNQYPATQCIQRKVTIHLLIEQVLNMF
ncbi:unnamed protein product [Didymodactylos carnosus]|uniref:Uncharacterized protein n=1 Tax=Didymodactylos carnosus TaxID=1234261 RepID=A0A814PVN0_9BILA|nr:unnamed protein product [Didymodactylos carnosus]CAF3875430.1 unnamed protein product [Didymodactylos carnosus]